MQSNVTIEKLDLFKHADSKVAIIVADGKAGFCDVLHVFLTNDALASWLKTNRTEYPNVDFRYVEDYLGTAVNFAIWNDVEGMSLHSVPTTSFDITRQDLTVQADIFDAFGVLTSLKKGKTSMTEAAHILKKKMVFFVGNIPSDGTKVEKKDMVFGKTLTNNAVATFLTAESAQTYAGFDSKVPISSCKLSALSEYFDHQYAVRIEPERSFSVELPAEALM